MKNLKVNDVIVLNGEFWIVEKVNNERQTASLRAAMKVHSHGYDQYKPNGMIQVHSQQTIFDSANLVRRDGAIEPRWV